MATTLNTGNGGEGSETVIELTERQSELRERFDSAMKEVYRDGDKPLIIPEASKDTFYDVWTNWKELDANTQSHLKQTLDEGDLYPSFLAKWNEAHPVGADGKMEEYPDYTPKE